MSILYKVASISAVLALFGALFAGPGADIFGRKPLLLINAFVFVSGYHNTHYTKLLATAPSA